MNPAGLIHNVIVGEDVTGLVENHAGTEAALGFGLLLAAHARLAIKEMKEEIFAGIVRITLGVVALGLAINHLGGGDIDDGRFDTIDDTKKTNSTTGWDRAAQAGAALVPAKAKPRIAETLPFTKVPIKIPMTRVAAIDTVAINFRRRVQSTTFLTLIHLECSYLYRGPVHLPRV